MSWHVGMMPRERDCFLKTHTFIIKGLQKEPSVLWGPGGLASAPQHR